MNIITIDCGASFIKGALFEEGVMVKQLQKNAPNLQKDNEIFEPVQIQALIVLVEQMLLDLASDETEIKLCISNEMHGFILAYKDGTPFTDYISWQKEYGKKQIYDASPFEMLSADEYKADIQNTGMRLRAGLPSCNLLYLSMCHSLDKVKEKVFFYTLGDYILKRLSGKEPLCHPTNAAASGLYDLRTNDWNKKLIRVIGCEDIVFPTIGEKEQIFMWNSLQIHALPAIGDQQAALLGAGLAQENTISFNLGTGSQVSRLVKEPICSTEYQIRPYFYHMYLKTMPHLPSGRALNVYIRFIKDVLKQFKIELTEEELWSHLLKAEQECEDTELLCDMSFFENPITDHTVGSIGNIQEYGLNVGTLMKGIFLQLGKNFVWAADVIEPNVKCIEKIIFSGGVARKIESIRREVLAHYDEDTEVVVAENETLMGLYLYGKGESI